MILIFFLFCFKIIFYLFISTHKIGGGNEPTEDDLDREDAEKEDKIERDDEDYLREKREWDEFKDSNPAGMGNRLRQG